jgi:hypothetical protein
MIVRAQIAWWPDSALPRDAVTINPHFEHTAGGFTTTDWEDFADDLAIAMATYGGNAYQTRVSIYDAQGTVPVFPEAVKTKLPGVHSASSWPREVALCLSYYSGNNVPKKRGRLFIPISILRSTPGLRPDAAQRTKALDCGTLLANAGGADLDWVVWSKTDGLAHSVTNSWVDDEWDTMRSRGLKSTTRSVATHSE